MKPRRCRFRLANAWHCITHDKFWHPEKSECDGASTKPLVR